MSASYIDFLDWRASVLDDLARQIETSMEIAGDLGDHTSIREAYDTARETWYRGNEAEIKKQIEELHRVVMREREREAEIWATAVYRRPRR
jgi:hypothetical protein